MAGLDRVAAVYRLLERVRLAEAMTASAGVAEVERGLAELEVMQVSARVSATAGVADAVTRTGAQLCLESTAVMSQRLQALHRTRVQEREQALVHLSASRVRVKQVEETILAARRVEEAEASKHAQAEADERFLAQQFQAGRKR